jgi:shikimate dehydrogenase
MRLFGLIGFPLSHSYSAEFFKKKFADENITEAEYRLFPITDISQLPDLIEKQPDLQGFNITIPYKVKILAQLDHISKVASDVGAVNCVKIEREASGVKLFGYNTDVYGFRESLLPLLKPYHYSALILGTGGAAKAVSYVLLELGIGYTMVSRTCREKYCLNYPQLTEEIIQENLIIINTTPVGMYPDTEKYPGIPYQFLSNKHLLIDLIYNPSETLFLKLGRESGAVTKNGMQMLELQAEKSWRIWNSIQ